MADAEEKTQEELEEPQATGDNSGSSGSSGNGGGGESAATEAPAEETATLDTTAPETAAPEASAEETERKLKPHEILELEAIVRKHIKHDSGFRKHASAGDRREARAALKTLGRTKLTWDHSIDLNMINTKSIVRPKVGKNSID